jgi:hypothetical protein
MTADNYLQKTALKKDFKALYKLPDDHIEFIFTFVKKTLYNLSAYNDFHLAPSHFLKLLEITSKEIHDEITE